MQSYLIAAGNKPHPNFLPHFINVAASEGVPLRAALIVEGPGCMNLAFTIDEPNEQFVNTLTMALMPAKWETTANPREVVAGQIYGVRPDELVLGIFVDLINNISC